MPKITGVRVRAVRHLATSHFSLQCRAGCVQCSGVVAEEDAVLDVRVVDARPAVAQVVPRGLFEPGVRLLCRRPVVHLHRHIPSGLVDGMQGRAVPLVPPGHVSEQALDLLAGDVREVRKVLDHPLVLPEQFGLVVLLGFVVALRKAPRERHERHVRLAPEGRRLDDLLAGVEAGLGVVVGVGQPHRLLDQRHLGRAFVQRVGLRQQLLDLVAGVGHGSSLRYAVGAGLTTSSVTSESRSAK